MESIRLGGISSLVMPTPQKHDHRGLSYETECLVGYRNGGDTDQGILQMHAVQCEISDLEIGHM